MAQFFFDRPNIHNHPNYFDFPQKIKICPSPMPAIHSEVIAEPSFYTLGRLVINNKHVGPRSPCCPISPPVSRPENTKRIKIFKDCPHRDKVVLRATRAEAESHWRQPGQRGRARASSQSAEKGPNRPGAGSGSPPSRRVGRPAAPEPGSHPPSGGCRKLRSAPSPRGR